MTTIFLFFDSPTQIMLVLAVILLLFGSSKLPQLAKSLGQSKRAFKEGLDEAEAEAARKREQLNSTTAKPSLSAVDDETLFEEARRRAQAMRANEVKQIEEGKQ